MYWSVCQLVYILLTPQGDIGGDGEKGEEGAKGEKVHKNSALLGLVCVSFLG